MSELSTSPPDAPSVAREPVNGPCPRCGVEKLRRYPVLSEGGWFMAVKCQECLHSVDRTPWNLLGPVQLTSSGLVID
jgi:vanillate/4-hydroxybenzoate decarboxylase subunit D